MAHRNMFMIIDKEIKYLSSDTMDHRDWYKSLGLDESLFENVVRGLIIDNRAFFYKGFNFSYDIEVMNAARKYGKNVRRTINNPNLIICCGIIVDSISGKPEPIVVIKDEELDENLVIEEKKEKEEKKELVENNDYVEENKIVSKPIHKVNYGKIENGSIIDFKNDYTDDKYIKCAVNVTFGVLALDFVIKIFLFIQNKTLHANQFGDILFVLIQFGLLGYTIFSYKRKSYSAKYIALVASLFLIFNFNIFDVIIGILYFVFTIDLSYFTDGYSFVKKIINKKKER